MKNEDMPANAQSFSMIDGECGTAMTHLTKEEIIENKGETKREKAFWQVYSSICTSAIHFNPDSCDELARHAINAVNAGFKALESDNE